MCLCPLEGGGGVGISPRCIVLVCSWRRLLADRHSPPFPWTLSFCRRRCPSASHRPVPFLFLLGLSFPLYFPFLSLGRLCRRSPRTFPVSLLRVESTRRRATAFAVGQLEPLEGGGGLAVGGGRGGGRPDSSERWVCGKTNGGKANAETLPTSFPTRRSSWYDNTHTHEALNQQWTLAVVVGTVLAPKAAGETILGGQQTLTFR